jgi:hypothetical protein
MSRFTQMFGHFRRPAPSPAPLSVHSAIIGKAGHADGASDHGDLIDTDADRMMRLGREVWGLALIKLH